jgi:hypothetical protein
VVAVLLSLRLEERPLRTDAHLQMTAGE